MHNSTDIAICSKKIEPTGRAKLRSNGAICGFNRSTQASHSLRRLSFRPHGDPAGAGDMDAAINVRIGHASLWARLHAFVRGYAGVDKITAAARRHRRVVMVRRANRLLRAIDAAIERGDRAEAESLLGKVKAVLEAGGL